MRVGVAVGGALSQSTQGTLSTARVPSKGGARVVGNLGLGGGGRGCVPGLQSAYLRVVRSVCLGQSQPLFLNAVDPRL